MRKAGFCQCFEVCLDRDENKELYNMIAQIVAEEAGINVDNVVSDSRLRRDLKMDKEDVLNLEFVLEEVLGISLPYGSLWGGSISVRDIVWNVLNCLAEEKKGGKEHRRKGSGIGCTAT